MGRRKWIAEQKMSIVLLYHRWIAEGLTLCFIGILVITITIWGENNPVSIYIY